MFIIIRCCCLNVSGKTLVLNMGQDLKLILQSWIWKVSHLGRTLYFFITSKISFSVEDPWNPKWNIVITISLINLYNMPEAVVDDCNALTYPSNSNADDVDDFGILSLVIIRLDVVLRDILSRMCLRHEIFSLGYR